MANLGQTRRRFTTLLIALIIFDAAVLAFLFSPFTQNRSVREQARAEAERNLRTKSREVEPLRGMDEKLKKTDADLSRFYRNRFSAQNSTIASELGKLAEKNGVHLSNAKYEEKDSGLTGLTQVGIDASLDGEYLNVVKFIGALEKDKLFFILDSIGLSGQQGGAVRLQMKLETFLRET